VTTPMPAFLDEPDFRETVMLLRANLAACIPNDRWDDILSLRNALLQAETPAVTEALCYLCDHLIYHEQWLKAARLLAYSLPAICAEAPQVRRMLERILVLGEQVQTPEAEVAHGRRRSVYSLPDDIANAASILPERARYWIWSSRVRGAAVALEYGCDHGTHVIAAAEAFPDMRWIGVDLRAGQIAANQAQAERLGLTNVRFLVAGDPESIDIADSVGVLDTLEHTAHRDAMMEAAEACCKSSGIVVVTTPCGPWGLHGHTGMDPPPGGHVGVESMFGLCAYLFGRGRLLHAQEKPGAAIEGNSSACVVYEPWSKKR